MGERFWSTSNCRPDVWWYGISGQGCWYWTARFGQYWVSGGVHQKYSQVAYEWGIHVIQSFDGIGPGVAGAIFDRFGLPIQWTVTKADLESVPGVGKKRASKMWETLNGE